MESYLPYITGSGGALAVLAIGLWLFLTGRLHSDREYTTKEAENTELRRENNQLRDALETERKTTNELTAAGQVTNQLITALIMLAGGRKPDPASQLPTGNLP